MNYIRRGRAVFTTCVLLVLCLALLILPGCGIAGHETKAETVFIGNPPVRGAAQIATDAKIPIVMLGEKNETLRESRSLGQFIVLPPWEYDSLIKNQK